MSNVATFFKESIFKKISSQLFLLLPILVICSSCAHYKSHTVKNFTGTFSGTTADGKSTKVTFKQKGNALSGIGTVEDQKFTLSGIVSHYAPVVVNSQENGSHTAYFTLSVNGKKVTLLGLGGPLTLKRGGAKVEEAPGAFTGKYSTQDMQKSIRLSLIQFGELLSGTGYYGSRPVAFAGKVHAVEKATGELLFSDESRIKIKAKLSEEGNLLIIRENTAKFELFRQ